MGRSTLVKSILTVGNVLLAEVVAQMIYLLHRIAEETVRLTTEMNTTDSMSTYLRPDVQDFLTHVVSR